MGVLVAWDNQNRTALRYDFVGEWTWQDFLTALSQAHAILSGLPHQVDVIANFASSNVVPTEILARLGYVATTKPANLGKTVIVGTSAFFSTTFTVFSVFYPSLAYTYRLAWTVAQARLLLGYSSPVPAVSSDIPLSDDEAYDPITDFFNGLL